MSTPQELTSSQEHDVQEEQAGVAIIENYIKLVEEQPVVTDSGSWQNFSNSGPWGNFDRGSGSGGGSWSRS